MLEPLGDRALDRNATTTAKPAKPARGATGERVSVYRGDYACHQRLWGVSKRVKRVRVFPDCIPRGVCRDSGPAVRFDAL